MGGIRCRFYSGFEVKRFGSVNERFMEDFDNVSMRKEVGFKQIGF